MAGTRKNIPTEETTERIPVDFKEWDAAKEYIEFLENWIQAQNLVNTAITQRKTEDRSFEEIMQFVNSIF